MVLVTPPVAFIVFLKVSPFLITSKPVTAFDGSVLSIVNDTALIMNITSSLTIALITNLFVFVVSLIVADFICVTVAPAPCGPIKTYPDPL